MTEDPHDVIRIALMLQKQESDEEEIRELKKRVGKLENSVFAAQIGTAVIIAMGVFLGWLASTGNSIRSLFK